MGMQLCGKYVQMYSERVQQVRKVHAGVIRDVGAGGCSIGYAATWRIIK